MIFHFILLIWYILEIFPKFPFIFDYIPTYTPSHPLNRDSPTNLSTSIVIKSASFQLIFHPWLFWHVITFCRIFMLISCTWKFRKRHPNSVAIPVTTSPRIHRACNVIDHLLPHLLNALFFFIFTCQNFSTLWCFFTHFIDLVGTLCCWFIR